MAYHGSGDDGYGDGDDSEWGSGGEGCDGLEKQEVAMIACARRKKVADQGKWHW